MVALFIANNSDLVDLPEGISRDELKYQTKQAAKCTHPQKTMSIGFTVSVGDMFKPVDVCYTAATGRPMILLPTHRFIVLQLSHPQQTYSLIGDYHTNPEDTTVSSVVIQCNATHNPVNMSDILSVLMLRRHDALIGILRMCELVGNVSHLL